ncbi:MAG TPA: ABC transporter permease [Candidatus Nanopelagicales bacterium]|jgi:spermidine/putrescine transport system permease protein
MALDTSSPSRVSAKGPAPVYRKSRNPLVWVREHIISIMAFFAFCYLLLPNAVVILFSFNKPNGRFNYQWSTFSLDAWKNICGAPGICESLTLSLKIAFLSTLAATILGTMIAFALIRHRFWGRSGTNLIIFLPMATPEVVMGSSLLTLFVNIGIPLGFWTILIAHIMFCVSFVVVTVKARLASLDPRLEQAAADLYATEAQTFWRITFPLVAPGIGAAALLSFSLSFDDYIITNFNASPASVTFPMYVWGSATRGTPVQINVIGTIMFLLAVAIVGVGQLISMSRRRALK